MPSVSVAELSNRFRGWLHREPKAIVPRTILIVDSNAAYRKSTARLVESLGYQALQATSIAQGLDQVQEHDPEFVLLAFDIDDASGLDALAKIRELDGTTPVIMLAADLWDPRVAEAMRQGAVAYLARPFGPDDLRELLGRR